MAQSLMAGGSIGSLFLNLSPGLCESGWRLWGEMKQDGLAMCRICIQSFLKGRLLWRVVYKCVHVFVCVFILYITRETGRGGD